MPRPAAIFDLDGTLLAGISAERRFLRRALDAGAVRPAYFAAGALRALGWWDGRWEGIFAVSKAYLAGLACAPLERLGAACVADDVAPHLRRTLLERVAVHRAAGDAIVLLSGTLDFLGRGVAGILRADAMACTDLERRDGAFTGRVAGTYPHGPGKTERLRALARAHDLDLAASHAYANRGSDAAHLEQVGFAHAVAPDARLLRVARARGWTIHDT